jgi:hypothetical protein
MSLIFSKGNLNLVISHDLNKIHSLLQLDHFSTAARIITGSKLGYLNVYKFTTGVLGSKKIARLKC